MSQEYTEKEIRNYVSNHVCEVTFKKRDDSIRKMTCTANWNWLNRDDVANYVGFCPPSGKNKKEWKPGQICVFDLDREDWRSFYVDTVRDIRIIQRLDEKF